jgi:choline kinase
MILILLAAGKGSRLPKKYRKKPKCLSKINNKSILDYNLNFYNRFSKKLIVTGYKNFLLKKFIKENNFKEIKNKNYFKTNMVESLFLTSKFITDDVIICYGDVIFDDSIFEKLKKKKNLLPIYKNWFNYWKKRMKKNQIYADAENLKTKNNKLVEIGTKIQSTLPSYQYMGIIKLGGKKFFEMKKFYKKINNKKIDMTSFINECLKSKILNIDVVKYSKFWFEIDSGKDIKVAENGLK